MVQKDVLLTFLKYLWYVCSMMYATNTGQALKPVMSQCLFSKDSRQWSGFTVSWCVNPKFPSLLCLSPLLFLLLILKPKESQDYLVTGKMFTPVNKTFIRNLHNSWPHSTWTFNSWRCAKGKDVKLQSSYPEEDVIQTYKEMTVFFCLFVSSFTINTFNSLAERQAKFKIVHIWKLYHTLC